MESNFLHADVTGNKMLLFSQVAGLDELTLLLMMKIVFFSVIVGKKNTASSQSNILYLGLKQS